MKTLARDTIDVRYYTGRRFVLDAPDASMQTSLGHPLQVLKPHIAAFPIMLRRPGGGWGALRRNISKVNQDTNGLGSIGKHKNGISAEDWPRGGRRCGTGAIARP